jgi:hypothetical protein
VNPQRALVIEKAAGLTGAREEGIQVISQNGLKDVRWFMVTPSCLNFSTRLFLEDP